MQQDILFYMYNFAGGGAERVMIQLANHWAAKGAAVVIAVSMAEGPLRSEVDDRVLVEGLNRRHGLLASPALATALRRHAPRAIISAISEQNVTACLARRLSGVSARLLTVDHNFISVELGARSWPRRLMMRTLMRLAYPMADARAAVSQAAARDLEVLLGFKPDSFDTLYNPIWPMTLTPGITPAALHPWLAEPIPVMLNVARLVPQKNQVNLLEALAIARRSRPLRLMVLGQGPIAGALEEKAAELGITEAVAFLGFRRDVADFLRFADLFVLSSDLEGLPLSLMEAMKVGTPVVSTDCPSGPRELLEDGRHGRLVPVRDPEALAAAILETLEAPTPAAALERRAADFDIEAVARSYESLLFAGMPVPWRCGNDNEAPCRDVPRTDHATTEG